MLLPCQPSRTAPPMRLLLVLLLCYCRLPCLRGAKMFNLLTCAHARGRLCYPNLLRKCFKRLRQVRFLGCCAWGERKYGFSVFLCCLFDFGRICVLCFCVCVLRSCVVVCIFVVFFLAFFEGLCCPPTPPGCVEWALPCAGGFFPPDLPMNFVFAFAFILNYGCLIAHHRNLSSPLR